MIGRNGLAIALLIRLIMVFMVQAPPILAVSGLYGPFIHCGSYNDGLHPHQGIRYRHRDTWGLWGVLDGALLIREGPSAAERRLLGPVALLAPPDPQREIEPALGSAWYHLRFDAVHLPRRRVLKRGAGCSWCHSGPVEQPGPQELWGCVPPLEVPAGLREGALQTLRRCGALWWRDDRRHAQANALLGAWLMDYVMACATDEVADDAGSLEARCRRLVREGMHQGLSVADLAAAEGLSLAQFKRRFAAGVGTAPGAWLRRLRLEEACRRLHAGEDGVAGVADYCGYRSTAAFVRAFAREFGVTPGAWRDA